MEDRWPPNPPVARGGSRVPAWAWILLFFAVLIGLTFIPYASHEAMVDAVLARETARHRYLVERVASWLRDESDGIASLMAGIHTIPEAATDGDRARGLDVEAAWGSLAGIHSVDGLQVVDRSGAVRVFRGNADPDDPLTEPSMAATADRALRSPDRVVADVWKGGKGELRMTLGTTTADAQGRLDCAVVVSLDLGSMLRRLFGREARDLDVTFTVMTERGALLMHSGFSSMMAQTDRSQCVHCHAHPPSPTPAGPSSAWRDRVRGGDRLVVQTWVTFGDDRWSLWASTPMEEVLRPLAQLQIMSFFFTGLVVVFMLLLGLLLRRSQLRRVHLEQSLRGKDQLLALAAEKEMLQQELESSRRMASIGLMVARVAHEVKNPLQYMGTGIELLGSTVRDESAQALVRDLKTGVRTLDAIVKELLDFSRPMTLDLMPVQANDLVREVAARLAEPEVDIVLDLDPALPEVRLDAYKVRQVLENLVRNSMQALAGRGPDASRGRIRLVTAAVREGPLAGGVSIRVEDDGPGIAPDALASIWDPFYTTKTRGSGLGLSVVRRIVDAHGGTVSVRSRPGEGAVFEVILPPGGGGVA